MTRYLLDLASYQGALRMADVQRAGFQVVNFKTSHAVNSTHASIHPNLAALVAEAKTRKIGLSSFHWLTGDASGTAQADHAYARLRALGLTSGAAHVVDVEEQADTDAEKPPGLAHVTDYVKRMKALLGRPIMIYTGDWWWTAPGRGWNGAALSPYLHAATNDGYPGKYPGDTAPAWRAGYGGWPNLSAMQYAVDVLYFPDGTKGTIKVSKTAIRDEQVWKTLTGTGDLVTTQAEFDTLMTSWWTRNAGPNLAKALTGIDAVLANVKADDADLSTIRAEIQAAARAIETGVEVDLQAAAKSIVSGLAAAVVDTGDLAAILAVALGDRATEVGQALQTGPAS